MFPGATVPGAVSRQSRPHEISGFFVPPTGISDDLLLNAIDAGIVGGMSSGLVYRSGGTVGGTGILSRLIQRHKSPFKNNFLLVPGLGVEDPRRGELGGSSGGTRPV